MALDQTARAGVPGEPSQADFDAIHDTMMASARGRWFLTEFARRNRSADTTAVLAAIDQIGAHLRGEELPPNAPEYLHLGLMAMAGLVAAVEADMSALSTGHETEDGAKPRVRRVVGTLRDLGDCIQVMLDGFKSKETAEPPPAENRAPPAPLTVIAAVEAVSADTEAGAEQSVAPPVLETATAASALVAAEPEPLPPILEYESDFVPFEFEEPEQVNATALALPKVEPFAVPAGTPAPRDRALNKAFSDPLGELRMLSQAELVALFS